MNPKVSIIIVNWNSKDYIKNCIDSLLNQTFQDFEIILVDNGSTDDSLEYVEKKYPQISIIKNKKNLGFAAGNNIGIKNSSGKFIALFNQDAVTDKEWLYELVGALESSEKIAGAVGKIFYLGDKYDKDAVFCTWSKLSPYSANPTN